MKAVTFIAIYYAALAVLCVSGCSDQAPTLPTGAMTEGGDGRFTIRTPGSMMDVDAAPVSVDGCQYYACSVHGGSVLSHRGDCTNCWARLEASLHRRLEAQDMVEVVLTNKVMVPRGP